MAYNIQVGKTDKARNSTKITTLTATINVVMKEDSSIIRPIWKLHMGSEGCPSMEELAGYNYCYCGHLKRYYYILYVEPISASVSLIHCEVDVLATFRDDILNTNAFIMYAESKYNSLLPDTRLPISYASKCYVSQQVIPDTDQSGCFVLTAATPNNDGSTGPAASVVMPESALSSLANKLYGAEWYDSIKNEFYHPNEALISCIWTPLVAGQATSGGYQQITVGKYDLGGGSTAKKTVDDSFVVPVRLPYASTQQGSKYAGDYRNFEPYSQYLLWLPGVGLVKLPMKNLLDGTTALSGNINLPVRFSASPITGDVEYQIMRPTYSGGGIADSPIILNVKGNFGVQIPIATQHGSFGSVVQSLITGIGGAAVAVVGALSANPVAFGAGMTTALGSTVNSVASSIETNTMVSGGMGGWSLPPQYNMAIESITLTWEVSDEPSNIAKTIGRPLFANGRIGSFSGFISCTGAYVKTWATEEEHQMIANYVNTSTNYLYGGLIVE